jgi:membrane-bound metal-dependent hydrolase YbcI (DUF457 family)
MLGHSHSLSGAAAGAAAGEFVLHLSLPGTIALAAFTAGMALTPDLDSCGSSQARCLGFLTRSIAWVVRGLSGGHRHLSHSLAGIAAFTGLAWIACHFRGDIAGKAGLALLVTIAISSALEATHVTDGHLADLLGIAAAAGVIWYGYGLALIPVAVALGTTVHLIGDSATASGVMWLYPMSQHRFHFLPGRAAFTTGTRPETWIVDPLLTLALLALAVHEVMLSLPVHALVAAR